MQIKPISYSYRFKAHDYDGDSDISANNIYVTGSGDRADLASSTNPENGGMDVTTPETLQDMSFEERIAARFRRKTIPRSQ